MKRILCRLTLVLFTASLLFALASCSVIFGSDQTTVAATSAATTSDGTAAPTATGDATETEAVETAPAPETTAQDTAVPETSGLPVGEDTDDNFGPLHPF